ncbi:MAG: hypothetical protein ACJ78X_07440 [Myxococcales bacterium]
MWPREAAAIFRDYPDVGNVGGFASGAVQLLDTEGALIAENRDARASFRGWRRYRRWSPLDALYFFGYALTHYHALPFTLVDACPLRLRAARARRRGLRGVEVELPPEVHTHSRRQTFWFDDDGLLRRHDYVAEIVGSWAHGAHLWDDFVRIDGLPLARHRHVVLRLGRLATPLAVLDARFSDLTSIAAAPRRVWPGRRPFFLASAGAQDDVVGEG